MNSISVYSLYERFSLHISTIEIIIILMCVMQVNSEVLFIKKIYYLSKIGFWCLLATPKIDFWKIEFMGLLILSYTFMKPP